MASMTDPRATPHAADGMIGPHGAMDDHGADHGHDDHAHGSAGALGPVDVRAWGAGLLGIVLGLAVAVALGFGSGFLSR
jgi:hypothetical protein